MAIWMIWMGEIATELLKLDGTVLVIRNLLIQYELIYEGMDSEWLGKHVMMGIVIMEMGEQQHVLLRQDGTVQVDR